MFSLKNAHQNSLIGKFSVYTEWCRSRGTRFVRPRYLPIPPPGQTKVPEKAARQLWDPWHMVDLPLL